MTERDSHTKQWGSDVAKGGFENEKDVADKFRNWRSDSEAKRWLRVMGYTIDDIQDVSVDNLSHSVKPDIRVDVHTNHRTEKEFISIKRATSANYNQVDKRWVETYEDLWNIPEQAVTGLKLFVGRNGWQPRDVKDEHSLDITKLKDERRLYFDELPTPYAEAVKQFLENKSTDIIRHILAGEEPLATWILVTHVLDDGSTEWTLQDMEDAVNIMSGDFSTTSHGNIRVGDVTLQRKGGDNGRETAQKLQFKMRPLSLFPDK